MSTPTLATISAAFSQNRGATAVRELLFGNVVRDVGFGARTRDEAAQIIAETGGDPSARFNS